MTEHERDAAVARIESEAIGIRSRVDDLLAREDTRREAVDVAMVSGLRRVFHAVCALAVVQVAVVAAVAVLVIQGA